MVQTDPGPRQLQNCDVKSEQAADDVTAAADGNTTTVGVSPPAVGGGVEDDGAATGGREDKGRTTETSSDETGKQPDAERSNGGGSPPTSSSRRNRDIRSDDAATARGAARDDVTSWGGGGGGGDPEKASVLADADRPVRADFETAIDLAGYGRFHYALLAVCGFVSTSEEMDVISMSFILPSAQCDLKLNTHTKGWLNSIIFIGMMAGAYAWGSVADSVGRKRVLIAISFMNALCIVASSFSQTYELFMFFRFLNGAALGGSGPVIWSYFAEFQPKSKRGSMLSFMAAFWTLGNLAVAGLAWLIIPTGIGVHGVHFTYNSWRIFLLLCAVPSLIVAVLLFFLPESPKFLLSRGRNEEALDIFRGIYHTNTGKPREQYPVKELLLDESATPSPPDTPSSVQNPDQKIVAPSVIAGGEKESAAVVAVSLHRDQGDVIAGGGNVKGCKLTKTTDDKKIKKKQKTKGKYHMMLTDILDNSKQLFKPPILRFTVISITINFTFHIGYYGLMMWFPELFNRFDEYARHHPMASPPSDATSDGTVEASVCEVTRYVVTHGSHSASAVCSDVIPSAVFLESLITVAAAIPSNIVAVLGMDRLGRKFFLVFSTFTSGLCAACMFFVYNKRHNLIVSAVFSSVISCGNAALDCLITEVFPTHLRATGVAISMVAARLGGIIGNVVIATLLDMYCPAPTFIVAFLLAGGGLMCLFLPNTTREPLS